MSWIVYDYHADMRDVMKLTQLYDAVLADHYIHSKKERQQKSWIATNAQTKRLDCCDKEATKQATTQAGVSHWFQGRAFVGSFLPFS